MVAVFNKELLSWYLITLNSETVESAIPKSPTGTQLLEFPEQPLQNQQQKPSDSLQIEIEDDGENCRGNKVF